MKRTTSFLLALAAVAVVVSTASVPAASGSDSVEVEPAASAPLQPIVRYASRHDTSAPLRLVQPVSHEAGLTLREIPTMPIIRPDGYDGERQTPSRDSVLQDRFLRPHGMPAPLQNFEGIHNIDGMLPPDTQGDVGPNHYVQWVNLSFAIWDKAGNLLDGPASGNTLWAGFGGPCETTNDGDPVTLYDHLADRWLMSQFALPDLSKGPYYECIAISQTADPTGPWHRYEFLVSYTKMNDYPKLGVWPDGYYMTINQFTGGSSWGGAGVFAFERDKMLLGEIAQMIGFDLYNVDSDFGGMLPSDLDGPAPPPGAPNYFVEVDDATWIPPTDAMRLWEFHVDWTTPANSTFGLSGQPNAVVPVASFTPLCVNTLSCIPQPGTSTRLDGIGDRLMYRLAYRNMGSHESLVVNHTVDAGARRAGIRWYEVRDPGGTPVIHQQGTYAPADGLHRWMGSIAMDSTGNIALGYSVSSDSVYPSIRYTGRLVDDPLGIMGQGETDLVAGSGSQTHSASRWGDYSTMSVDPVDDCTFWYTQEYVETTGSASWQTRIGSFRFPNCTPQGQGTLFGTVYDSSTLAPVAGALVRASSSLTRAFETTSGAGGTYTITLASGVYTVTGSAYGYYPNGVAGVAISDGAVVTQDIPLSPVPVYVVSGTVTDASTGWPLYARVDIDGYGSRGVWTDPVTGFYSITLAGETLYTFNGAAWVDGYLPDIRSVGPLTADATVSLTLDVDAGNCDAPGYVMAGECRPLPGGLVIGNVADGYTGNPLNGAAVANDRGDLVITGMTMEPAVDDGFYTILSSAGAHTLTATHYHYGPAVVSPTVVQSDTIRQDFYLSAGRLSYSPAGLAVTLTWGTSATVPLTLTNAGDITASFELVELEPAAGALGPFQMPDVVVKPFKQNFSTTHRVNLPDPPPAPPYAAGDVVQSWSAGARNAWAAVPSSWEGGDTIWLASPSDGWSGDGRFYEYTLDGTPTARSHPFVWRPPFGPADAAVNWHTGMLWVMNVDSAGDSNCIYEVDLARGYTGDRVCPGGSGFASSQRGLAYDPQNDTWYAGGWNDRMVTHFDATGTLLRVTDVGLGVSGLAYNPDTRHLFAMTNDERSQVYVLDVADDYAPVGQFSVGAGFGPYAGAGLEFDCVGNLWAVDQATNAVYQFESGETTGLCQYDIPWLSTTPLTGSIGPVSEQMISVTFDARSLVIPNWGTRYGRLKVEHDTPYPLGDVVLTMTVGAPPPALTLTKTPARDPVGIGLPLSYTITVGNAAGPATGVTISDTLPVNTRFESASHGGALVGKDVIWSGLSISGVDGLSVFYTVTVDTVSPGTPIVNVAYQVTATEWLTPVLGQPVTVTAATQGADITVRPANLAAALSPGETVNATMTIGNVGASGLSWALAAMPSVSWLNVAETGGSVVPLGSTDVVVTFTAPITAVLPVYTTTLRISSSDPDQPTVTVPVTLAVTGGCERIGGVDFVYRPAVPMAGDRVVFTGTAVAGTVHLPVTYTWDLGDGSAARVGRVITHVFPLAATGRSYTVTLSIANACPSWGVAEKMITVRPHTIYLPVTARTGGSASFPMNGPTQEERSEPPPRGQRPGAPNVVAPIPALVRVDLRSSSDLERVAAGLASESQLALDEGASGSSPLVYAHLFDTVGQEHLLLPADVLQQEVLIQQGLSLRVLDPDSRDAAYYMLHVRRPGALRQARALVTILDEDGDCDSGHPALPLWATGVGPTGCQVLARATTTQAERLVELGIDLQPLILHSLVQLSEEMAHLLVSDVTFSPPVQEMIDQVQTNTVISYDGGLSGEWPVIVGGAPYTIVTRHSYSGEPISKATHHAYEHFQQAGLDAAFQEYTWDGNHWRNVVAEQPGSTEPAQIVLITAHIDAMPSGPIAPGADDNASGTTAVLIAADILSQYRFRYTLRYVLFTGEEQGLRGSAAYADHVYATGEDIAGVLNLDMIAYNSDAAPVLDLHARSALPASVQIADTFSQVVALYNLDLTPDIVIDYWLGNYSDNKSFWDKGYPAILAIEDEDDFTPYYHTTGDLLATLDVPYFTRFVRAAVGTIAHLAGPPDSYLAGRVYDDQTGVSIVGAEVEASSSAIPVGSTTSGAGGTYHLALPAGVYSVTAVAPWYVSTVAGGIAVTSSQTVTLDIPLQPTPCDAVTGAALTYLPLAPWVGGTVVFTGSITSGTLPIAYAWAFGDGVKGVGSAATHIYEVSGVYTVAVTATNCGGRTSSVATRSITVTDCPMKADFTYEPMMPRIGEMVTFTGVVSVSTANSPITTTWDFGDGSPPLSVGVGDDMDGSAVVTHTFPLATAVRTYTVTMGVPGICSGSQLVQKGITVRPYSVYLPAIVRDGL